MTKEEIYELINGWIDGGKLVQKSAMIENGRWYGVWKAVERGEAFFTSHERIVATDKDVRDRFQRLLGEGRVMTTAEVTIRHPECTSVHAINKLVSRGGLLKVDKFSSITLFIE